MPDRRRHKRIAVTLLGRFMRESKEEHPCKLIDISAGGAAVLPRCRCRWASAWSPTSITSAASRARSCATFEGGFAFKINATKHKREKLAAQLTWLANRSELAATTAAATIASRPTTASRRCSWPKASCSPAGCSTSPSPALPSPPRRGPTIGTEVMLGKLRARVVRHHPQGFGVQFLDIQNPAALRRYFG